MSARCVLRDLHLMFNGAEPYNKGKNNARLEICAKSDNVQNKDERQCNLAETQLPVL